MSTAWVQQHEIALQQGMGTACMGTLHMAARAQPWVLPGYTTPKGTKTLLFIQGNIDKLYKTTWWVDWTHAAAEPRLPLEYM